MNAPRKFLFDTSFESAAKSSAPRRVKGKPAVKTYTENELIQAREDGFAAGKQAGQQASEDSLQRQVAQALTAMTQQIADLGKAQADALERRSREAIEAALSVTRKLFPRFAQVHGMAEIEAVVGESLTRLHGEPRIVVRVADPLLDAVNERVSALAAKVGFEGKIVLIAQDDLQAGDVRVEWADGGAERDSNTLWRQIDAVIERVMGAPLLAEPTESAGGVAPDAARVETTPELDRPKAVSQ